MGAGGPRCGNADSWRGSSLRGEIDLQPGVWPQWNTHVRVEEEGEGILVGEGGGGIVEDLQRPGRSDRGNLRPISQATAGAASGVSSTSTQRTRSERGSNTRTTASTDRPRIVTFARPTTQLTAHDPSRQSVHMEGVRVGVHSVQGGASAYGYSLPPSSQPQGVGDQFVYPPPQQVDLGPGVGSQGSQGDIPQCGFSLPQPQVVGDQGVYPPPPHVDVGPLMSSRQARVPINTQLTGAPSFRGGYVSQAQAPGAGVSQPQGVVVSQPWIGGNPQLLPQTDTAPPLAMLQPGCQVGASSTMPRSGRGARIGGSVVPGPRAG